MLTESQASEVVHDSLQAVTKNSTIPRGDQSLKDSGVTEKQFRSLVEVIAANVKLGVPRYQHYLDANRIAELSVATSVKDLTERVLKLSAGKLCSNPTNPHQQPCCPYPDTCGECGFPVL